MFTGDKLWGQGGFALMSILQLEKWMSTVHTIVQWKETQVSLLLEPTASRAPSGCAAGDLKSQAYLSSSVKADYMGSPEGPFQLWHARKSSLTSGNLGGHFRVVSCIIWLLGVFWAVYELHLLNLGGKSFSCLHLVYLSNFETEISQF